MAKAWEVNFEGLVGPTHNYAGLSYGNLAAMDHGGDRSSPKEAALKGLEKMRLLMDLGVKQAVIPPQERPDLPTLRRLGFRGGDETVLSRAAKEAPEMLAALSSASSMWTANAATISPSSDTLDGKVHVTPANLISHMHRAIEAEPTAHILKKIFGDENLFNHHPPLPLQASLGDEGAANHLRLAGDHGSQGIEVFVYGRKGLRNSERGPARFPARQTREASEAVARLHRLDPGRILFMRQDPDLIDMGVFHNDVVSTSNENLFFYHTRSFAAAGEAAERICALYRDCCGRHPVFISVGEKECSIEDAVSTYLFNSQIVTLPDGKMSLISPVECQENRGTRTLIKRVISDETNPIASVHYVQLRQSMKNGGGPACLRLRAVLNKEELAGLHQGVLLTPARYTSLETWIHRHYRDRLTPKDLADPKLLTESRSALDELSGILGLGSIYTFQRTGNSPPCTV